MKLEKKQHVSRVEKQDLSQAKTNLEKQDKHLQPAEYLSEKGKQYFEIIAKYLQKQSTTDSQIDSFMVNELAEELTTYNITTQLLKKHGLLTSDGKRNPLLMIRNNTLKNVLSLSSALGLTINGRIKANLINVQQGNSSDPLKDLLN